jgi:hypothetical protein
VLGLAGLRADDCRDAQRRRQQPKKPRSHLLLPVLREMVSPAKRRFFAVGRYAKWCRYHDQSK